MLQKFLTIKVRQKAIHIVDYGRFRILYLPGAAALAKRQLPAFSPISRNSKFARITALFWKPTRAENFAIEKMME